MHPSSARRKSLRAVLGIVRDFQWLIIAALLGSAVVAAFLSYRAQHRAEGHTPDKILYVTSQLFLLNAESGLSGDPAQADPGAGRDGATVDGRQDGKARWPVLGLMFARLAAVIVVVYGFAKGLPILFREQWRRLSIRLRCRRHVIVCGLGEKGRFIARQFLVSGINGEPVRGVALDKDGENPYTVEVESWGIPVLIGSAADVEVLHRAGLERASYLICVGPDDETNLRIMESARQLAAEEGNSSLLIRVHVEDRTLLHLLREKAASESGRGADWDRIQYFNVYESGAVALLADNPPLDDLRALRDGSGSPHILVAGVGQFGESVASLAARWWWGASGGETKLRITLLGSDAEARRERLLRLHSWVADFSELHAVPCDVFSEMFSQAVPEDLSAAYVCHDQAARALYVARLLSLHPALEETRVVARLSYPPDLIGDLRLRSFNLLPEICRPEFIINGLLELHAHVIHMAYVRKRVSAGDGMETNSSLVSWSRLSPHMREANREQARDTDRKLAKLGCRKIPLTRWSGNPFRFEPFELDELAREEHNRWMTQKLAAGWTYSPDGKDEQLKTHDALVEWEQLPDHQKAKDREVIQELPAILAAAGYAAERIRRNERRDDLSVTETGPRG